MQVFHADVKEEWLLFIGSDGLRRRGGLCNDYSGGLLGSKFQNAVVCTKAHYNRHLIGSYLRSVNQASSFNACNVKTSFTASNWWAITRLGFLKNLPELKKN